MRRSCLVPYASAIGSAFATVVLAGVLLTSVPARADVDVRINIGNAPPAPHFVFRARPHERYFSGEGVYIVDDPAFGDNDCFRYGGYYWLFRDGYWYRSASWRGRFMVVQPRYVPTVFYRVPPTHWKHHPSGPPGHMHQGGGPPGHMNQGGGPPGHMNQGGGPPGHTNQGGGPPGHMNQGGGPPGHMNQGGGPPGQMKKGDSGPPGHAKKSAKEADKHGDRGGK